MAENVEISGKDALLEETSSQRILLEEFRTLHVDYTELRSEGVTRLNFFIASMSVVLGGFLIVISNRGNVPISYIKILLLVTLVVLGYIGYEICNFLVQRDITSDRTIRGLARIRHYFIELDPTIKDYFVNRISDTPSGFLINRNTGMRRSAALIESLLIGLAIAVLLSFVNLLFLLDIIVGIVAAVVSFICLEVGARRKLDEAIKSAEKYMVLSDDFSKKKN
jgi:hypothetical protein